MSLNDCLEINAEIEICDTLDVCAEVSADSILNQEYYEHIQNHDNPHKVTTEQINAKRKCTIYTQETPESVWTISHNRNDYPVLVIFDDFKNQIIGDISYISPDVLQVTFSEPIAGIAYIN